MALNSRSTDGLRTGGTVFVASDRCLARLMSAAMPRAHLVHCMPGNPIRRSTSANSSPLRTLVCSVLHIHPVGARLCSNRSTEAMRRFYEMTVRCTAQRVRPSISTARTFPTPTHVPTGTCDKTACVDRVSCGIALFIHYRTLIVSRAVPNPIRDARLLQPWPA
jgi:hypothetical protein